MASDPASRRATAPAPPAPAAGPAPRRSRLDRYLAPKKPIPRTLALALGVSCFALVIGIWALLSYTGQVRSYFLPTPVTTARTLYDMFVHRGFIHDVWASTYRIMLGFLIAAAIAIPLGIAIGAFRVVQAFFEPLIAAIRYMPASAFIPLLIIWLGIAVGWAWTYLIVAELVAANTGIGHVILSASRFLQTDQIIAGIVTIGILGLLTDAIFRWLHRTLFPYTERVSR